MADFDPAVPPGGEGKITLTVNTKGYQGSVRKSARVKTNDPLNKDVTLVIKANVKVPVFVSSRYVHLYGSGGSAVEKTVTIRGELEKPLHLTVAEFNPQDKLKYTIETVQKDKEYRVKFTSIPGIKENYRGTLKLKTNYPEKPEIDLYIQGRFKSAAVSPGPYHRASGKMRRTGAQKPPNRPFTFLPDTSAFTEKKETSSARQWKSMLKRANPWTSP